MKTWIENLKYTLPAFLLFFACNPEIDIPVSSPGAADFSNYIAVGNSLTAGYQDNGLYAEGQMQSYPYLISQQLREVAIVDFKQPDIPGNGSGYIYLTSTAPAFGAFEADPEWSDQVEGPFNNLGVPGIRVRDIKFSLYGSEDVNPYFHRMLGGKPATTTYLEMVNESEPTFFTCWMGNNDVLGYAASGGAAGIEGGILGINGLTPISEFAQLYNELMASLSSGGAKGVVITLPDVTAAPYFTTIAWDNLVIDAATAVAANAFYASQIDPQVQAGVQEAVITLTVTEQAVSSMVIPSVAQGAVYKQAYDAAIAGDATPAEADAAAQAFVASAEGQAAIASLDSSLNAELRNHLLGDHTNHASLEPLYAIIDNELATNEALQQGIIQGINILTTAYENDQLPPEDKAALDAAIAAGTAQQIASLKAAGIYPTFEEGANGVVIEVPASASNPLGIRQMVEGELVLLTALLDGQFEGTTALEPKADKYILTEDELQNISEYTTRYNQIIMSHASAGNIGVFEVDEAMDEISEGVFIDGTSMNAEFITGGAFSLDGIHLTPRGYAFVANKIIGVINSEFGASITPVILNNHRAVILP